MARCEWAIACVSAETDGAEISLHRIFQVLQIQYVPASVSVCCVFGIRGEPAEVLTLALRLIGPRGEVVPTGEFPRFIEITFTDVVFHAIMHLQNLELEAGKYRYQMGIPGTPTAFGTVHFEVVEVPSTALH
ncbi:MAG TPA: hypothetical protein VES67_07255 [Vicinamibacterales bacterium]|nr:hypothetical protein [Vicinamibacterales bacterium]